MSVNLTIAGGTYPIPSESTDKDWGDEVTTALQALSAQGVYLTTAQTLTNKTLTSPTISGVAQSGGNISTSNKAVDAALFDAGTLLFAESDNTPLAKTIAQFHTLMLAAGFGTPVGTIQEYTGAAAPTGWVLANKSTPESIGDTGSGASLTGSGYSALYAILWDSAGTDDTYSHKISSAKGASAAADFAAGKTITIDYRGGVLRATGTGSGWTETTESNTLGRKQDDKMQGHKHTTVSNLYYNSGDFTANLSQAVPLNFAGQAEIGTPITDGTNGTPRTAKETRMKNIGVSLIIKY